MTIEIRKEQVTDVAAIYRLNSTAFESDAEAKLVDLLRDNVELIISLVAVKDNEVVGHILFSPMTLNGAEKLKLYGLAPMAVSPELQNQGVGSQLIKAGLAECKAQGIAAVFVLGHSDYYPKFGFRPSSEFNISSEYDVPEEVFMCLELLPGALSKLSGTVKYSAEFASV